MLTAGTTPQEELIGLTGTAVPRATRPAPGSPDAQVSVYDCAVGAMRARVEIEHPSGRVRSEQGATYPSLGDILGAPALRYYGDGFKLRRQYVEDVLLDMAQLRSSATVRLDPAGSELATQGTDGRYQPSVSLVDCFVANLQLAQVLMYELDGVTRRESNTLWMLRTVLEAPQPMRSLAAPLPTVTAITGKHLVPLRGGRWRNVEIRGGCGGVDLRASFAHELPPSAAATAR
ncbi:AvrD family protein [Micromonospora sp. Llam0]|uniref:AvrD family protein n=1 Tax=Micromonospora sp. Llam0 TaxID=2485143 RepID=UPI0013153FA1|nr:AvrD family protein [Micromonospora sp. Llam0]